MLNTGFYFNGEKSVDKGIYLIHMSPSITSPFLAKKKLITEKIAGRDKPYYFGDEKEPLILKVALSCLEGHWTTEKRRELARWLDTETYAPFYSVDDPSKWYYCQYKGGIDLSMNGVMQGTIEIEFECDSPYAYSPYFTDVFEFSDIGSYVDFTLENEGDLDMQPEIWIEKVDTGSLTIDNLSYPQTGQFKFDELIQGETVYVNNELQTIETDISNRYRYNDFNDNYLTLKRGSNTLRVRGKCRIQVRRQYKILG